MAVKRCPHKHTGFCSKCSKYSMAILLDHHGEHLKINGYNPKIYCYMALNKKGYAYNREKLMKVYQDHKTEFHPYAREYRFYDNHTGSLIEKIIDTAHPSNIGKNIGNNHAFAKTK